MELDHYGSNQYFSGSTLADLLAASFAGSVLLKTEIPRPLAWVALTAVLLALAPWPYAYYQLLRWFLCGLMAYGVYISIDKPKPWVPWVLGGFAVLYNPVIPIHLGREIWSVVNLITAVVIYLAMLHGKGKDEVETGES
jgi:hypothetical protein